jgi:hypothetical protein
MKICVYLWQCLAEFLECEMFQTKIVDKLKTNFLCSIAFSEDRAVYEIIWKKCGRSVQATVENIWRIRSACGITQGKNADTHSEYVIILFHGNSGYGNAPQRTVIL